MQHKNILIQTIGYIWSKNSSRLKHAIIIAFLFLTLSKIVNVLIPVLFKHILDGLSNHQLSFPILLLIAYAGSRVVSQLLNELKEVIFARVEQESVRKLALSVFCHLHSLSLRFHLDRKTGAITRSMERGAKALENVMRFSMLNIIPTTFEVVIVSIILCVLYPIEYMLVTLVTLSMYATYTIMITEWRAKQIRQMKDAENQSSFRAIESLLNYETVKYFTNEKHEAEKYDELLQRYKKITIKNRNSLSVLNIGQSLIISIGLSIIMIFAYRGVMSGVMTSGDFVLVNMYLMQLYQPLSNLGFSYREVKLALVDMEHMFCLLEEKEEIKDSVDDKPLIASSTSVCFSHVNFHYSSKRNILSDIYFQLPAGNTLAIVGPSGSGKSTITRLLFRFYDVIKGEILIGGNNIEHYTQESLRKMIGVVPQDTVLFNDSIKYNIHYGNAEANFTEIQEAAKIAEIHNFINSLPDGYDTVVGERGLKLSGGEKQRIAIARTILKQPKIFVFDEATSSLDTHTEAEIQKSIDKIAANHTTIIIAHRLSTVIHADEIIVLEKGKIVERGTHSNLLMKNDLYARMWNQQKSADKIQEIV